MSRKAESGTVSVYFIIATAAFVLLTALLIDFSRIAAFRYHAELAVQAGVRSVLSSYDPVMYDRYGLFIRGGEDAGQIIRVTAEGRLAGGSFAYLGAEWNGEDVTESRPLADHEVFRRQVLEEMKYKGPIDLALELADRFRGVSSAVKEAAATVDVLENMRKAYDRREAALDEVFDTEQQAGQHTAALLRKLADSAADFAAQYDTYAAAKRAEEDVSAYESRAAALASSLAEAARVTRSALDDASSTGSRALQRARQANDEMRVISMHAAAALPSSGTGGDGTLDHGEQVDQGKVETISSLRDSAAQLVLDSGYFDTYAMELDTERRRGWEAAEEAERLSGVVSSVAASAGIGSTLQAGAHNLSRICQEFDRAYGQNGVILQERRRLLEAQRSGDRERKAYERQAQTEWSGVTGVFRALSGSSATKEEREVFQTAADLTRNNLDWNRTEDMHVQSGVPGDPSEGRDRAMTVANGFLDALQGSLSGFRDELYFSEYTMQRFSRFVPADLKRLLRGEQVPLSLDRQESEYILYGFGNPTGNLAAAYTEILSIRLAIRTMEGLIECRALGHPLVVLAAALAYGVRHAAMDMNKLLDSGSVELSKYVQAETGYEDYLRLFLLLHGGSPGQMARSIAVIERETGVSLTGAYTYVSGEGTASLRLWFFPGLLKLMQRTGQLGGTVKGNRYEAVYTADSSYQ